MGTQKWNMKTALLLLFFLHNLVCLWTRTEAATTTTTTISYNQYIGDGDVLVSSGEKFALGFFSPASGKSNHRYVGIWIYNVSQPIILWVANRNNPLNDTSGVMSLNSTGNLIIRGSTTNNRTKLPVWSTDVSLANGRDISVAAKLLDSGNLVIVETESGRVLWQSFDHPTDTILPHMKIGMDWRSGLNRTLTSWRAMDDPRTGLYTHGIDTSGDIPQLFTFKGGVPYWRGGPWNGLRWSGVPEMDSIFMSDILYRNDSNETTISYGLAVYGPWHMCRLTLDEIGVVQAFTWREDIKQWFNFVTVPKDFCDPYGQCGAFTYCDPNKSSAEFECKCLPGYTPRGPMKWSHRDSSGGCVRKSANLICMDGSGFVKLEHVKLPDTRMARVDTHLSGEACEDLCTKNCTCVAYASANLSTGGSGSGCITWHGDLMDIKLYAKDGQDLYVRVDAVELENYIKRPKGLKGGKRIFVIAVVPIVLGALLLAFMWCFMYKRLPKLRWQAGEESHNIKSLLSLDSKNKINKEENINDESNKSINLPFFTLKEIKTATNNFANKLGEGGFGTVYQGQLTQGQEIAVKRLSKGSGQGAEEFKNEVLLITKLQHVNLVKVLGYCIDKEELMLIYEYMPNKSLDSFIFDQSRKQLLDWKKHYEIIIGIARGILYLHQDSRLRIVHRDLKTSNILLDGEMNPKISDFGMARIFRGNQTQENTKMVVGTLGYMSPEYALDGLFSMKSDVFSFGVILLEIISGKKNHAMFTDDPLSNLIRRTWDLWTQGRTLEITDGFMIDSCRDSEVLRCIQVGLLCVQEHAIDRPTMSAVVFMLSNEVTLPSPKQPAYALKRPEKDTASSSTTVSTLCSNNEFTITLVEPR